MWRTRIREEQSRIEAEKRIKYKGTVRIRLKWLHFQRNRPREVDDNNIERLKANLRKDCRDLDERNHIAAVIDQQSLRTAEVLSGVSVRQLGKYPQGGYPELVFPAGYQVDCLHGRHRILAAKELGLEWWTVDLYLADLDPRLKTYLIEEYSNEKKPNDGEIYRKIRHYHFQGDLHFEWRCWSLLSAHGQRCLKQLLRHEELVVALDALCRIPGLWGGMRLHTWNTILAMKCDDVILHSLHHIADVWGMLLQQNVTAMENVDEVTVKALELRAPRLCTRDANELRGQILGGTIFSAFGDDDRVAIWSRVQTIEGLIPSLDALFKNISYLKGLVDCMRRLVSPLPGDTISTALFKAFADTNQRTDRAIIQVTESSFSPCPASWADRADLGVRQLYAYAMRHYLQMPRDLEGKELLARHTSNVDPTALREFAGLAERLGFESPKITALKEIPQARSTRHLSENSKPLLVTDGAGVKRRRRCGLPSMEEYREESGYLFIHHLHEVDENQGEGLTSFFVRKSIYSALFGKPSSLPLEELRSRDDVRQAQERQEQEREEQEKQEQEKQEQERQEQERQEQERQEQEKQEREKQEQERQEIQEQERQKQKRQEQEKQEQEKQEREKQEQEKQMRQEQEKQEQIRQEQKKQEQEKQEQEKQEQEKQQQEKQEQEKQKQEKQKQERQEQEKQEREKQEQEKRDQQKKVKRQQAYQTRTEKDRQERLQRIKLTKRRGRPEGHVQRLPNPNLEDERILENQQRIGLDESFDIGEDIIPQTVEDNYAESSGTPLEEEFNSTKVRINFKVHDGDTWKPAPAYVVERSNSSKIEQVAINWIRAKWRLFTTELRMLAPQQCYNAVTADGTYTILLMRESEINVSYESLISATDIGIEAKTLPRSSIPE